MNHWKIVTILSLSSILMACSSTPPAPSTNTSDSQLEVEDNIDNRELNEMETSEGDLPDSDPDGIQVSSDDEFDYSNLEQEDDLPEFEVDPTPESGNGLSEKEQVVEVLPTKSEDGKLILGHKEWIYFPNSKRWFEASISEGQDISSISVSDVVPFERDGKKWVKFRVDHDDVSSKEFSLPVQRRMKAESQFPKAAVVLGWVQLGELKEKTEFVLSDKSEMSHPFILGKSFYRDIAVVDASREFVQPKNIK